jgi:hypothetical protein
LYEEKRENFGTKYSIINEANSGILDILSLIAEMPVGLWKTWSQN